METKNSEQNQKSKSLFGLGLLTAFTASLCCITPVLALLAGTSGLAASFSFMEPVRPYLLGITILVLGYAWYQKLKPINSEKMECACDEVKKPTFWQSKIFLGIVTVFAALLLAFPYYGQIFYPKTNKPIVGISLNNVKELKLNISGMTCESCETHIEHAVNGLPGIVSVSANSKDGNASVKFDISKTDEATIIKTIDSTGYKVIGQK